MKYVDGTNMEEFKKINTSSWDTLKNNVFLRLINKKCLNKYGENIAHINFMDLALVFSVQEKTNKTILSHILTEEELENLNVTLDEVKTVASKNTNYDKKKRILTFKESTLKNNTLYPVLQIPEKMAMGVDGDSPEICGFVQDTDNEKECDNILMLCNKYDIFGSSYMAVPEILEEVYERFNQENFYIVPLSIHQVMCVRSGYASCEGKKPFYEVEDDLLDMIESFNDKNNKSWKDILSYKIYYYIGNDGKKLFPVK